MSKYISILKKSRRQDFDRPADLISLESSSKRMVETVTNSKLSEIYGILNQWKAEVKHNENQWIRDHFRLQMNQLEVYIKNINKL